jgi:hypothetical protein
LGRLSKWEMAAAKNADAALEMVVSVPGFRESGSDKPPLLDREERAAERREITGSAHARQRVTFTRGA